MAGYSARINTYTSGDTIKAEDTNEEFDALVTAFGTSGHTHDGTAGNGGAVVALATNAPVLGAGTNADVVLTFNTSTLDGVLSWMEDEDYFKFADDIMLVDAETLIFGTDSDWTIKYDEAGDDDLVLTGSDISIESSTSAKPVMQLLNTNADANGATLKFNKNGASVADSDVIGNVDFVSEDDGSNVHTYGRIRGTVVDMTGGEEEGSLEFYVAEYDGTLTKGMDIVGLGSDGNITVDISTHDGAAGGLKLGGTLVTSTAAELNLLDGSAKSTSSITIGDTDAFIVIDGTTTTQIPASDIKTYVGAAALTGSTNNTIVTVTGANAIAGEATFTYDGSDLAILEAVNDGSPSFTIGAASAESGKIQAVYDSGAQTLNYLEISTATADGGADAGFIRFDVDGTDIFDIDDGGIKFANGSAWEIGVAATTSTTAGRALTVAAGSSSTNGNNINGGDLTLSSGGGDGTGTSKIDFKTKINGTDAPASKMQLSGAGVLTLSAGGIIVPDDGDVGSASTTDAIQISSAGIVTFKDDIKIKDGGTIGVASVADAMTVASTGIVTFKDDIIIKDGGTIGTGTTPAAMTVAAGGAVTFSAVPLLPNDTVATADIQDDAVTEAKMAGGLQTIWIPASAMRPTSSNGCASITDVESTSGRPDMQVLDFDPSSDEHAQFQVAFPKSWNEGTVTFAAYWTTTGSDTDTCAWGLQGVAVSDNDTIDVAYGTAVVVTDTLLSAAEDLHVTATSSAITIAGTPAVGDLCFFRIFRDVSADNMGEDGRLIGCKIFYTTDTGGDT